MPTAANPNLHEVDWSKIPAPADDGGARHLQGEQVPDVALTATDGSQVSLAKLAGRVVVFAYPRTGEPGKPSLVGDWDMIPGARGCTPQSCGFRDHHRELADLGAEVYGLSTQTTDYQREMADRLHLPFEVLSGARFALADALRLPTFEVEGMRLIKRLTLIVRDQCIEQVFYPVFPPNQSAAQVIDWLERHPI
jgi:peroxiredoxin